MSLVTPNCSTSKRNTFLYKDIKEWWESGFGRYDVLLELLHDTDDAIIPEFKVHAPDDENSLADMVQAALSQIDRMGYSAVLETKGIKPERMRKYGFAFEGKTVLIR